MVTELSCGVGFEEVLTWLVALLRELFTLFVVAVEAEDVVPEEQFIELSGEMVARVEFTSSLLPSVGVRGLS